MNLAKRLGVMHVFCIASGAMISSGIFVLPGLGYARAGPALVLSYLLAGLLAATGMLSTAELATAMPKAGSDYYFITRAMGPATGTVAGLFNWVSFSLKAAFALVGMGAVVALYVPLDARISGAALGVAFVVLNLVGVKEAARVQFALVAGLFGLMVVFVVRGMPVVSVERYIPFSPHGVPAVLATAGFVFVAYGGLLKIASVAEEVHTPGRTIPAGMILSLVVTAMFYALMVHVTVGVLPAEQLEGSVTPIADAALVFMGRRGQAALGIAAALAFLTTANAGIMTGSRYLLAMARDGMLPPVIGRVGGRFGTPFVAILVTGGLVILPLFVDLYVLVESASIGLILTNILANASVVMLRESRLQNYRPTFRAPLYPWLQVAGIIGFALLLVEMGVEAFLISSLLAVGGFCLYWFYGRARVQRESALLHILERITDRRLVGGSIERELKDIIRERDSIVLDRFDSLVEEATIVDVDASLDASELFRRVADALADRVDVPAADLGQLLLAREIETSTVIGDGLAIPHAIVPGKGVFAICLARSRAGFSFPEGDGPVYAAVVLIGTRDERNVHLRSLAAIAQIAQAPEFLTRWRAARGDQALRDLLLLGQRQRAPVGVPK